MNFIMKNFVKDNEKKKKKNYLFFNLFTECVYSR